MAANAQAFALANGIELSALVPAHDAAAGVLLVAGFLNVMLAAAVGFRLKGNLIRDGQRQVVQLCICERSHGIGPEGAFSQRLAVGGKDFLLRGVVNGALQRLPFFQKTAQFLLLPLVQGVRGVIRVEDFHHVSLHGGELLLQESG